MLLLNAYVLCAYNVQLEPLCSSGKRCLHAAQKQCLCVVAVCRTGGKAKTGRDSLLGHSLSILGSGAKRGACQTGDNSKVTEEGKNQ